MTKTAVRDAGTPGTTAAAPGAPGLLASPVSGTPGARIRRAFARAVGRTMGASSSSSSSSSSSPLAHATATASDRADSTSATSVAPSATASSRESPSDAPDWLMDRRRDSAGGGLADRLSSTGVDDDARAASSPSGPARPAPSSTLPLELDRPRTRPPPPPLPPPPLPLAHAAASAAFASSIIADSRPGPADRDRCFVTRFRAGRPRGFASPPPPLATTSPIPLSPRWSSISRTFALRFDSRDFPA